jgi:putative (di)nucleoside polyphosphate hydrolase
MKHAAQYFRAGVGAVIVDEHRHVLVLERADIPGAWQFPQGGLEKDEEPLTAVLREIEEETGIPTAKLELRARYPEPLAYELPPAKRSGKTGRGQVQYWFFFQFRGRRADIALPKDGEFRAWAWRSFDDVVKDAAPFRRAVYRRLRASFGRAHPAP